MRNAKSSRAVSVLVLATILALGPALAEARRGGGGGGRGGGGGGGIRSSGASSISRGSGGGMSASRGSYGGGARANTRPSGGYGGGERAGTRPSGGYAEGGRGTTRPGSDGGRINTGDRVNGGDRNNINSGNRINTGDVNINRNVDIDNDNGWGDWGDRPYYPIAGAIAVGAIAGATAAAVMGSTYYALPAGCSPYPYGGYSYYHCGSVYYETRYVGDKVTYVVVEAPG